MCLAVEAKDSSALHTAQSLFAQPSNLTLRALDRPSCAPQQAAIAWATYRSCLHSWPYHSMYHASRTRLANSFVLTRRTHEAVCAHHCPLTHPPGSFVVTTSHQKRSALMDALTFLTCLCPRNSGSRSATPIASLACMPRLPIAALVTVSRASASTNSL